MFFMSKQTVQIPLDPMSSSFFEEYPILHWIEKNGRLIFLALLAFAALLLFLYRHSSSQHSRAEQDYFQAANAIVQMKDPSKTSDALADLQAILSKHPELNARYDGPIAEDLLVANDLQQAAPYAEKVFQRVDKDLSPFYLQYAENSLSIAGGKKEEALQEARRLKERMQAADPKIFGPALYLFNLIRIAMLEKTLNLKAEELKSWDELLQVSKGKSPFATQTDFEKVVSLFEDRGVTLLEFIGSR